MRRSSFIADPPITKGFVRQCRFGGVPFYFCKRKQRLNWDVKQVRLGTSSAFNQVNDHHDNGNYEQEIDQTAADVDEGAQKPEHD
jgi:hypothetical protein